MCTPYNALAPGTLRIVPIESFVVPTEPGQIAIERTEPGGKTPVGNRDDWAVQAFHRIIYVMPHWMGSQRMSMGLLGEESWL